MKKLSLLALTLLITFFTFKPANASVFLKYGKDSNGRLQYSGGNGGSYSRNDNNGQSIGIELLDELNLDRPSELGYGIMYSSPRDLEDHEGRFSFVSAYLIENIFLASGKTAPYFSGQLGYTMWYGDTFFRNGDTLKGGIYYSFGIGYSFGNPRLEFSYMGAKGSKGDQELIYSKSNIKLLVILIM